MSALPKLLGCDFSSSPTRVKPIVLAWGFFQNGRVQLSKTEQIASLEAFDARLRQSDSWLGVFDLPFGLPRELVEHLGWPTRWPELMAHYASLSRQDIRQSFAAFCDARPAGKKFAHRAADKPAGSSPSMKWVNPPVAFMLHAGAPLLLGAGVHLPGLHEGDRQRVALEGYPGLLAREVLGKRSYKSDDKAKQTPERLIARKDLITALEHGQTRLQLRLKLTHAQRDSLDATLCMMRNLEMERLALASMAIGIARRCIDEMTHYAVQRTGLFGQSNLFAFGQVQQMIAERYPYR